MKNCFLFSVISCILSLTSIFICILAFLSGDSREILSYSSIVIAVFSITFSFLVDYCNRQENPSVATQTNEYQTIIKNKIRSIFDSSRFILPYIIDEADCYFVVIIFTEDKGETVTTLYSENTIIYRILEDNESPYLEEKNEKYFIYLPQTTKIELL